MTWYVCYKCQKQHQVQSSTYLPCIIMEPCFSGVNEHTDDDFRRMALMGDSPLLCPRKDGGGNTQSAMWKLITFAEVIRILEKASNLSRPVNISEEFKSAESQTNTLKSRFSNIEVVMADPKDSVEEPSTAVELP